MSSKIIVITSCFFKVVKHASTVILSNLVVVTKFSILTGLLERARITSYNVCYTKLLRESSEGQSFILATTTSTENSGLLAFVLPKFKEETGVTVEVVAVGTGQALQLGEDGNADVLLVHARALEDAFMAAGHGSRREDVT